jgi:hypothetical protein
VKEYLEEKNLPLKAHLVKDNSPAHPQGLEEDFSAEYGFIQVKFLPPNTTPLMDQQVISNFKKLYIKALFHRCFEVTLEAELILTDFWKDHFNILHCLRIIDKAWSRVSHRTMISAWKKLWPALGVCEPVADSEQDARVVEDIVSLGQFMSLEVDEEDVEELVKEHNTELTTEKLQDLHIEQQQEVAEELSSEEEKNNEGSIITADIKEQLGYWSKTHNLVEKWHPNVAVVNRCINLSDDNVMQHFRKILKSRQRQMTMDRFFSKKRSNDGSSSVSESQPSTSGFKGRRKSTSEG